MDGGGHRPEASRGAGKGVLVIGATGKDGAVQTLALEDVVRIVTSPAKFDAEAEVDTGSSRRVPRQGGIPAGNHSRGGKALWPALP